VKRLKRSSWSVPVWNLLFIPDGDQDGGHKTGSSCYQTTRPQETKTAVVRQAHWVIRSSPRRTLETSTDSLCYTVTWMWNSSTEDTLWKPILMYPVTPSLRPHEKAAIAFVSITNKHTILRFSDRASWIDYTLITNLMHWLLFIHKILFSSTCFEPPVLIFRRIQLYTCSIWYCHSLREFVVACRYAALAVPYAACIQLYPPEDEHLRLETCRGKWYFMNK